MSLCPSRLRLLRLTAKRVFVSKSGCLGVTNAARVARRAAESVDAVSKRFFVGGLRLCSTDKDSRDGDLDDVLLLVVL